MSKSRDSLEGLLRSALDLSDEQAEACWQRFRQSADEEAFRLLLASAGGRLYRRLKGLLRFDHLADEAFQDVLANLCREKQSIPTFAQARAWLWTSARNRATTVARAAQRREYHESRLVPRRESEPTDAELQSAIRAALAKLPDELKEAVIRRFFEGQTEREAADELGIPRSTLRSRVDAALARLKKDLGPFAPAVLGGVAGGGALATPPDVPPAARLSELITGGLTRVPPPAASGKWWLVAGVLVGCAGVGAVAAWPVPPRVVVPDVPAPAPETLQAKNLRVFNDQVRPKLLDALKMLSLGEGGEVKLVDLSTFDTRLECTAEVGHGATLPFRSRLRIAFETATGGLELKLDLMSNGNWRGLNVGQPIYWDNPLTGKRIEVKLKGLAEADAAFRGVAWGDPRIAGEVAARNTAFRAAARVYEGTWYEDGDATKPLTLRFDPDGPHPMEARFATGLVSSLGNPLNFKVGADGRLRGAVGFLNADGVLSADARRLDFPAVGRFWSREPVKK